MSKKYFSIALAALLATSASAAPRTLTEARALAQQFMNQKNGHKVVDSALRPALPTRAAGDQQPYYIFDDAEAQGFVIVSGTDLMREVIGYSTNSTMPASMDEMPDNLRSWMQWLSESAAYLEEHPEAALTLAEQQQEVTPVEPLMNSQWNQSPLYNNYCPPTAAGSSKLCPVGCTATATAQIVRYHLAKEQKVLQGKGSQSYVCNGVSLSVDYSQHTYDYAKMPLKLDGNSTEEEINEVAKLSYHIGVGVHMNYAAGGSGAWTSCVPLTLINNFGFNSNYRQVIRELYDFADWNTMLLDELYNKRPILYSGQSSTGGHAFVLEGVDAQGLYYVNWGWGGMSDGYFDVNVLRPSSVGTGATASPDGFCNFQTASRYLCLEEGVGELVPTVSVYNTITLKEGEYACGESIPLSDIIYVTNEGPFELSGSIGYSLMQNEALVDSCHHFAHGTLSGMNLDNGNMGYIVLSSGYPIPENLADGEYQLWLSFLQDGIEKPFLVRARYPSLSYTTLKVSGGKVSVTKPSYEAKLSADGWVMDDDNIQSNKPAKISVTVKNESQQTYVAKYFLTLVTSMGIQAKKIESADIPALAPGESADVSFDCEFPSPGTWSVVLTAKRQNVGEAGEDQVSGGTASLEVSAHPSMGAKFTMVAPFKILSEEALSPRGKVTVRYILSNSGTAYEGEFGLQFFSSIVSKDVKGETYAPVTFGITAKDSVDVELTVPELKENATYYVRAAYLRGDSYEQFSAKDGVTNRLKVNTGLTGIEAVTTDEPAPDYRQSTVYDILGKRVSVSADGVLPKGIYIINGRKTVIK